MEHCNSPVTEKDNRPGDKRSVQDHTASLSSSHDLIQNLDILNFFIPHGKKLAYVQLGLLNFLHLIHFNGSNKV